MNSNTINLVGGLIVPALWVGRGSAQGAMPYFIWLIDLTLLAVLAPLARGRLSRVAGAVIIAIYVIFVVLRVLGI
jgi:Ca2+/Na+ antiporter